jgi:XTP/dITP diphosphohydrolase
MDVTFVTSNPNKVAEARRLFAEFGIGVRWSRRDLPEPQAVRLEDVVLAKLAAAARPSRGVVVEDSGIFLSGLAGFPGVYSRYVYETIGLDGVLRLLPPRSRQATFRAVAGYRRGRTVLISRGEVRGTIALRRTGSNGFGYDPIFAPLGAGRTFAEMSGIEKDRLSHRGRAMRGLARKIRSLEKE